MATASIQHVRHLYKTVLRLHRGLPVEMRTLGDEYVREEFRRHKRANSEEAKTFVTEWTRYAVELAEQLRIPSQTMKKKLGIPLTSTQLDQFMPEQLQQLYELQQAAFKAYGKLNRSKV